MTSKFSLLSLFSKRLTTTSRPFARLLRDERGSYVVYMTLAIPMIIGIAGLGTEGGLLFYNHRNLHSAADAAAYSAAISYSANISTSTCVTPTTAQQNMITTEAEAAFANYGFVVGTDIGQANVTATVDCNTYTNPTTGAAVTAIDVSVVRNQLPILSGIDYSGYSVRATAVAIINGGNTNNATGNCLLTLGNAANSFAIQGGGHGPNINLNGCGAFVNSTDCSRGAVAVALGGNASVYTGSFGSAGCVTVSGSSNIGPPPASYTQQDGQVINPYAGVSTPTTSSPVSCTPTASINSQGKVTSDGTLCPNVYSQGISVKGNTVTLQPGIYVLEGEFQVGPGGGGTTVNGNGVTLVFTSATPNTPSSYPSTMLNFDSLANVTLTPPTTGPTAGFIVMGDSTMPVGTAFNLSANAQAVNLSGTVYLPNGAVSWQGTPTTTTATTCLQFIVNTISMGGTPGFGGSGCSTLGPGQKPINPGLVVQLVE